MTKVNLNIKLEPETRQKFKIKTIQQGTTMQDIVEAYIKEYIKDED